MENQMENEMETREYIGNIIGLIGCVYTYIYIYWGYIGRMEKKMGTTTMAYVGIMEKRTETAPFSQIGRFLGFRGSGDYVFRV